MTDIVPTPTDSGKTYPEETCAKCSTDLYLVGGVWVAKVGLHNSTDFRFDDECVVGCHSPERES